MKDQDIVALNPWWEQPEEIESDGAIRDLEDSPLEWTPPVWEAIDLDIPGVHTLRGPRQVGKTTTLKRFIKKLIDRGETRILYFAFDLATDPDAIREVVVRARQLHPEPEGAWWIFLDEVTRVPEWQRAIKFMVDNGPCREDFILCTGSSARKMSAEQLPGRRGDGRDLLQLPLSFRAYCDLRLDEPLPAEPAGLATILSGDSASSLRRLNLRSNEIARAWREFCRCGGFPAAVRDFHEEGRIRDSTCRMLWNLVAGDARDAGIGDTQALKLLERVGRSLGSRLAWTQLAEELDVSHPTAKKFVRVLSESFVLLPVYFWDMSGKELNARKQRKIYFVDILFDEVPKLIASGTHQTDSDAVRENIVAVSLFRSECRRLIQSGPVTGGLGYWRATSGREIDFVVPEQTEEVRGNRIPVEVKGDGQTAISNARQAIDRVFGRGIILTKTILDLDHRIPAIPVSVFLAALPEHPVREPLSV